MAKVAYSGCQAMGGIATSMTIVSMGMTKVVAALTSIASILKSGSGGNSETDAFNQAASTSAPENNFTK